MKSFTHRHNFNLFQRANDLRAALEAFVTAAWPQAEDWHALRGIGLLSNKEPVGGEIRNAAMFGTLIERHLKPVSPDLARAFVSMFTPGIISVDDFVRFTGGSALAVCGQIRAVLEQAENEARGADKRDYELTEMSDDLREQLPGFFSDALSLYLGV